MTDLPSTTRLSTTALSASFDEVTNSYKCYWFLAILDPVRESQSPVDAALYFNPFARMQYDAMQFVAHSPQGSRLLEDYLLLLKAESITSLQNTAYPAFCDSLYGEVAPQLQIAANMGFTAHWKYSP